MDKNKKIVLKPGYLLEKIDNEFAVYHPTSTTSLYLNETGSLIWQLCDGTRSTAEIIALLVGLYPESSEQIADQVEEFIRRLKENNIAVLQD
jgi:hypothetical protein